ncbi:MAG: Rrf2 family transcriptional regulator [Candidatus Omnitrophota bacterium]
MKVTAKCDYACKALLELAFHWPQEMPLQIHYISEKQKIPERYLVQILIQLKGRGLVASSRGQHGGYLLAKSPKEISLGQIVRMMTGESLVSLAESVELEKTIFTDIWAEVERAISKILDLATFDDIRNKFYSKEKAIFYQI